VWFKLNKRSGFGNNYLWKVPYYDQVSSGAQKGPYAVGTWKWTIPLHFRQAGSTDDKGKKYADANQEWASTAEGRCTIFKVLSGNYSRDPADASMKPEHWVNP
jgi:hypothetical protein